MFYTGESLYKRHIAQVTQGQDKYLMNAEIMFTMCQQEHVSKNLMP